MVARPRPDPQAVPGGRLGNPACPFGQPTRLPPESPPGLPALQGTRSLCDREWRVDRGGRRAEDRQPPLPAGHHRCVRAESHMMFTPRGPAALRTTTSDPSATTGPSLGARREHGSPDPRDPRDPGACPGGAADRRHRDERPPADGGVYMMCNPADSREAERPWGSPAPTMAPPDSTCRGRRNRSHSGRGGPSALPRAYIGRPTACPRAVNSRP